MLNHVIVDGQRRLAQLSDSTGLSISRVSQIVTDLDDKGLLKKKKHGLGLWVDLSESIVSDDLARVFRYGHIKPREVISNSKLPLLAVLAAKRLGGEELTRQTGLSSETVRKYVRQMLRLGVIRREGDRYALSSTVPHLCAFLRDWTRFENRKKLREISKYATILWECGTEFVFATPIGEPPKEGLPTALTAMYGYGIELLVEDEYYHYIPWLEHLGPEDIALDTILLAPDSSRMLTFALLLLREPDEIDQTYLLKRAEELSIRDKAADLIRYLRGKAVADPLYPSTEEFERLLSIHGVSVSREDTLERRT